jgi:hypothetical protein
MVNGSSQIQNYSSRKEISREEQQSKLEYKKNENMMRFQVLTAASMKIIIFWVVGPCRLVEA